MGELDKFKSKSKALSLEGRQSEIVKRPDQSARPWEGYGTPETSDSAAAILGGGKGQFAIALDATGSMYGLISMAKEAINQIMSRVFSEAKQKIQIQLFTYRDYDVPQIVLESSKLSPDAGELASWLDRVEATGGGGNDGEAIETALNAIIQLGEFDAVLLAGDEPYNSRSYLDSIDRKDNPTAGDLARKFGQAKCPIHTFVVGDYPQTIKDFKELSSSSGGQMGKLDGSEGMIDMAVLAMLATMKGKGFVRDYMSRNQLTDSGKEFGVLLLEGPKS